MSIPVFTDVAWIVTSRTLVAGFSGLKLIVPCKPVKEPVTLNPKFLILNFTEDCSGTGRSTWEAEVKELIRTVKMNMFLTITYVARVKATTKDLYCKSPIMGIQYRISVGINTNHVVYHALPENFRKRRPAHKPESQGWKCMFNARYHQITNNRINIVKVFTCLFEIYLIRALIFVVG